MAEHLRDQIRTTAFAFRGYNVTNLGRSPELLAHPAYGATVRRRLDEASGIVGDVLGKKVCLAQRVERREETDLDSYSEAIALIVAMEVAQIELLEQFHGIRYADARLAFGYSLGELSALSCGGVVPMAEVLVPPLAMSPDCARLARDVKLGVLFSRGPALNLDNVQRLCLRVNQQGQGVMGISSILSPNSVLILGQQDTLERFQAQMHVLLHPRVHLRINPHHWPPLHTPIMWQCAIPNRAARLMHTLQGGFVPPQPPVVSLVTGKISYNDFNFRELMHRWVDHPQRLWDAVYEVLASGAETIVHVGPEPNLIPATFRRLSENVRAQAANHSLSRWGLRAMSHMIRRPWLAAVMASRAALLRAPLVRHIILEDWLLQQHVE